MQFDQASKTIALWIEDGLRAIRFSGGEPLMYPRLSELVQQSKRGGIGRIAISSNGSYDLAQYERLIFEGVNDLSISLDACCAEDGDRISGSPNGSWNKVVENIRALSKQTYVTVGVVLSEFNAHKINEIICFADSLGVDDIRVIPAAQLGKSINSIFVREEALENHPILRYRIDNAKNNITVRGLALSDSRSCGLVLDDMAVCGDCHYPCIIYLREGGRPIGKVGSAMRIERREWYESHNCHTDPICHKNCLDVCRDYNNRFAELRAGR